MYLDPIAAKDAAGNDTGQVSDPAADVMAYLLSVPTDWKPETSATPELSADEMLALNDLTTVWLSASFPRLRAERFAKQGIDPSMASSVKVDERVLIGPFKDDSERAQKQLEYVARRSMSRYGCFGCHDIPGYEAAKPIGTPLANWGRKDPAQLAFENIGGFLASHGEFLPKRGQSNEDVNHESTGVGVTPAMAASPGDHSEEHSGGHGVDPLDEKYDADTGYFLQSLAGHSRQGFLWQKLRMPRSFDYETTKDEAIR